jgi:hypothetical protein
LRIRARTLRRILAVTPAQLADRSFVSAKSTWRLIRQLLEEGYTKAAIARLLGYKSPALQFRRTRVFASTEMRVKRLHSKLMN